MHPEGWDAVCRFSEAPRSTYAELRSIEVDRAASREVLAQFLEAVRFNTCEPQDSYIRSIGLGR